MKKMFDGKKAAIFGTESNPVFFCVKKKKTMNEV
jgi:hypothetical protein